MRAVKSAVGNTSVPFCTSRVYEFDNDRIIIWVIASKTHLCSSVPSVANLYSTNRPAKRDTGICGKLVSPQAEHQNPWQNLYSTNRPAKRGTAIRGKPAAGGQVKLNNICYRFIAAGRPTFVETKTN